MFDTHPDGEFDSTIEFLRLTVPAQASRLAPLRRQLRRCLAPLPMPTNRKDELFLAVSEAVANCVEHAYDPADSGIVELTFWTETNALCVQIRDYGRWRAPASSPSAAAQGLGIQLMRRLVDCVLIQHGDHGTTVLLRHPIAQPAADRPRRRAPFTPTRAPRPRRRSLLEPPPPPKLGQRVGGPTAGRAARDVVLLPTRASRCRRSRLLWSATCPCPSKHANSSLPNHSSPRSPWL
jgi:anti-sigma regulatory factor (Ser/Thr protein kinase)